MHKRRCKCLARNLMVAGQPVGHFYEANSWRRRLLRAACLTKLEAIKKQAPAIRAEAMQYAHK